MRRLNRTVLSGGVLYPAGQQTTPDLEAAISNPAFWDDPDAQYVNVTPVESQPDEPTDPADPSADPPTPPSVVDYTTWDYDALVAEVKRRNDERDDEHHLRPESRKGEDLAAALTADDEAYPA